MDPSARVFLKHCIIPTVCLPCLVSGSRQLYKCTFALLSTFIRVQGHEALKVYLSHKCSRRVQEVRINW